MSIEWLGSSLFCGVAALLGVLAFQCRHDIACWCGLVLGLETTFFALTSADGGSAQPDHTFRSLVGAWFASGFMGLYLIT